MLIGVLLVVGAVFACLGGWVASQKHRDPGEGYLLGFFFGPFGVLVEALLPTLEAKPEPPSSMAASFKVKTTEQGRIVQNLQDEAKVRELREANGRKLDEEWLARKAEQDRVRDERREASRERNRYLFKFGWFADVPDWLQPIIIGMAVSIPLLAIAIYVIGPRL